jgi:hypothetical protein
VALTGAGAAQGNCELVKGTIEEAGWTCNVCERGLEPGELVWSCPDCDWDGCKPCLDEAQKEEQAAVQRQAEEEGEGEAAAAVPGDERVPRFACRGGHALEENRADTGTFACDVCGERLPQAALIYSCRTCDFDGCGLCMARLAVAESAPLPKMLLSGSETPPAAACPQQHSLREFCTPSADWACDECRTQQSHGSFMWGCRRCNWDLCAHCLKLRVGEAALPSPATSSGQGLVSEIMRLKRSKEVTARNR